MNAMITTQRNPTSYRHHGGFSMIDVLVAIVVLATALLALAALQGALTRNSADAKARAQIAAYSEGIIDQLRSTGYASIASGTLSASSGTATQKAAASALQTAAGVSNLTTTITATRYYGSGSTFTTTAVTAAPEYKQITARTAWTDASGQPRTLSIDTIADVTQTDQTDQTLINKSLSLTGATGPIVREYNPGATAGVIPIAIGGSDTAATNPQPEVLGKNGTSVSGVSFNVLTYSAPETGTQQTVIQQHVDTRVIQCSCKYGAGISDQTNVLAQPYQPTFWDGIKYVVPKTTTAKTSNTGVDPNANQDAFCDACCRDRNDSGTSSPKFDPWTSDYAHYRYSGGSLVAVPSSDTTDAYINDCRMIRVDGQYRVAVDMQNYFFGLLKTTTNGTSPIPDPAAVTNYQTFITDYLNASISSLALGNGPASRATWTTNYGNAPYNLNLPTNIGLTSGTDTRYLHARGLYIDYLEPDALAAINKAITNCPGTSTPSDCVLPLLPFTTINQTELAAWTSVGTGVITVTNTSSLTADDPLAPLRGVTTEVAGASNGATANATATVGLSNSGVIGNVSSWAADPEDLATTLTDAQQFTIGGSTGGGGTTLYFDVAMAFPTTPASYNWIPTVASSLPSVGWNGTAAQLGVAVTTQATAVDELVTTGSPHSWLWFQTACTTPKKGPRTCTPNAVTPAIAAPVGLNIIVGDYNKHVEYNGTDSVNASDGHACPSTVALQCFNYPVDVANVKVNGTTVTGATSAAYPTGTTDLTGQAAKTIVTIPATPGISSTNAARA